MNDRYDENLRELFEQFWDANEAQQHIDDIERGEQIIREHPAPEPDEMLLSNIKAEITLHLLPRRAMRIKHIVYRLATVAAAIIIIVAIGTSFLEESPHMEPRDDIYTASVFPWDNHDSAVFNTELEQIESDLRALESGEEEAYSDTDMAEMELEVIEYASDFWKG